MRVPGVLSIYALLLVVGCVTQEELEAQRMGDELRRQQAEAAYMQRLSDRCSQFGNQAGSERHAQCMQSLHQQNQANQGAILQGVAAEAMRQDAEREQERRRLLYPNQRR